MDPEDIDTSGENIAATLARELREAKVIKETPCAHMDEDAAVTIVALPYGHTLEQIDNEHLLPGPRKPKLTARFVDVPSFLEYVNYHAEQRTRSTVWAHFEPAKSELKFNAVLDEHDNESGRWRLMRAELNLRLSHEWSIWTGKNRQAMPQVTFAEFLEENESDILAGDGLPSSADMLKLATELVLRGEKLLKNSITLQDGSQRLEFVDASDQATLDNLRLFKKFRIGVPVFWSMPVDGQPVPAYPVEARLKVVKQNQAAHFKYELIRPDRVYQTAALKLIDEIRQGLNGVPLLMGAAD